MGIFKSCQLILLSLILLTACSPERKLAKKFVKEDKPGAVMLITPAMVYKNSFKIPYVENFESLPQETKDSISFFNSDVVQFCDDSTYINNFLEGLNRGFRFFGLQVYHGNDASDFLNNGKESYIFNFAQIQLEEFLDSISEQTSYDSSAANTEAIFVTAVNMNNWIEITKLNHVKSEPTMLFSSQMITDDFNGHFIYYPLTGEFDYQYTVDSLTVDKLYNSARTLGFRHAQWLFDYLLNDYILKNMPEGKLREKMFSYDFEYRILKKLKYQPFEEIPENDTLSVN